MGKGGSSSNTTKNTTDITTVTNVENIVDVDLLPLGEVLVESQEFSAQIYSDGQISAAQTNKEAATIELVNSELDRNANKKTMLQLDGYIEHAKNGLVLSAIVAGLLYYSKKSKKGGKKK